jgi:diaminopimelate decarboxylase
VIWTDIDLELLKIGDIIYFVNMGAYTTSLKTPFNGFEETKILHFIDFKDW